MVSENRTVLIIASNLSPGPPSSIHFNRAHRRIGLAGSLPQKKDATKNILLGPLPRILQPANLHRRIRNLESFWNVSFYWWITMQFSSQLISLKQIMTWAKKANQLPISIPWSRVRQISKPFLQAVKTTYVPWGVVKSVIKIWNWWSILISPVRICLNKQLSSLFNQLFH